MRGSLLRKSICIAALLGGVWLPPVMAGKFNVTPVSVTLPARAKSTAVTITNNGSKPLTLHVRLYQWSKQGGLDQLLPTTELLVIPPILQLAPAASQIVRIGRSGAIAVPEIEKTYRIITTEVALPRQQRAPEQGIAIRPLLEISIPVFVPPVKVVKQLQWSPVALADDYGLILNVLNTGTVHSKITAARLLDTNGAVLAVQKDMFYVLPQLQSRLELPLSRVLRPGEPLRLEYLADYAAHSFALQAPAR